MLKEIFAIIVLVGLFWALQIFGFITYFWVVVLGVIMLLFGFLFTVAIADTVEGSALIKLGAIFLLTGLLIIFLPPANLPRLI